MNTTLRFRTLILVAGLAAPAAFAQNAQPAAAPAEPKQTSIFPALPAETPKFESMAKIGPDGKVIQIGGILDARSLLRNPLVDDATRERLRPAIEDWAADINQLAIDNLDFLEKIDNERMIDDLDFNDTDKVRMMAQVMVPFISAGSLSTRLQNTGQITSEQGSLNEIITNDYLQKIFDEIMSAGTKLDPIHNQEDLDRQQDKIQNINKLTHFLYYTSCRDARESYHRIMIDAAPMADRVIEGMGLSDEDRAKVGESVASAKAGKTDEERRERVRSMLKHLEFGQRRAFLQKAVEMGAAKNPLDAVK